MGQFFMGRVGRDKHSWCFPVRSRGRRFSRDRRLLHHAGMHRTYHDSIHTVTWKSWCNHGWFRHWYHIQWPVARGGLIHGHVEPHSGFPRLAWRNHNCSCTEGRPYKASCRKDGRSLGTCATCKNLYRRASWRWLRVSMSVRNYTGYLLVDGIEIFSWVLLDTILSQKFYTL